MKANITNLILEAPSNLVAVANPSALAVNLTWKNNADARSYQEIEVYCNGVLCGIVPKNEDGSLPEATVITTPDSQSDGPPPFVNGQSYKFTVQAYGPQWPWETDSELSNEATVQV